MPNPLHKVTQIFKDHFTCDDKDIYIDTIRLIDHCATELDSYDYETNSDGERILGELEESVTEYEKSQREDDEEVIDEGEDEDKERNLEDLDEDEVPPATEEKVT